MSLDPINIGAAANDGTGDEARTAFEKINDGFTEVDTLGALVRGPGTPALRGGQMHSLWNVNHLGAAGAPLGGFEVAPYFEKALAHQASQIVATAALPRWLLVDGGYIDVTAHAVVYGDTVDPRIYWDTAFEIDGAMTAIRPVTGSYGGVTLPDNGIEISHHTVGENAMSMDFAEDLDMVLSLRIYVMGQYATQDFVGAPSRGNVRCVGSVKWGKLRQPEYGGLTSPGGLVDGENAQWSPVTKGNFQERGVTVVNHENAYRAIWNMPGGHDGGDPGPTTEQLYQQQLIAANADLLTLNRLSYEPGGSRYWRRNWFKLRQEMPLDFVSDLDVTAENVLFHLRAGGPRQMDTSYVAPAHTTASGTTYTATHELGVGDVDPDTAGPVLVGGVTYVPRYTHDSAVGFTAPDTTSAGVDGAWNTRWRAMTPFRLDRFLITQTTATAFGGRVGVSDIPLS